MTFRGVFLINVIYVIKKARYHPLAAVLQSPENYNLLERGEEVSEAGEQSTASSPRATDDNGEQPARPAMAASPFTPIGSQSTHGSSVGVNTPSLLSLPGATPDGQSSCESNPRQGPASSAPGSGLVSRVRATGRHLEWLLTSSNRKSIDLVACCS